MTVATDTEAKDLLARTIGPACHELRSPLAVVFGFAKMLENNDTLDATLKRYVEHIVNGAQRLDELLDALARSGRIAAGRISPTVEQISLAAVVDELATTGANADRLIVDKGTELTVKGDHEWLLNAFAGVVEGLCFEEGLRVRLSWTHDDHEARVAFTPDASYPMVDTEPEKASLDIALARMRLVSMGGSLEPAGDRVLAVIPRA